ncbi:hypothetical protein L1987_02690 [Smallanthus sonchifolius]|uniref:Uncharacterized protein n=1 Tax=Smallanthus sonchifolius TaxID=185202 RepID=A0ACB9K8E7_9ASTR|nr:hypothetical protein L1987_02690 [Smallanthus sonchifolius]
MLDFLGPVIIFFLAFVILRKRVVLVAAPFRRQMYIDASFNLFLCHFILFMPFLYHMFLVLINTKVSISL